MLDALLLKFSNIHPGEYLFVIGAIYLAMVLAHERRWAVAAVSLCGALLWLYFQIPVADYLKSLSTDSFAEAQQFDIDEASFWWFSFLDSLHPIFSVRKLGVYGATSVCAYLIMRFALRGLAESHHPAWLRLNVTIACLLFAGALYDTTHQAVTTYAANSERFETIARNFDQPTPALKHPRGAMELIVYIGESTTVMNMGLYGYTRDTTPRLSRLHREDDALLVFKNVLSTHTHTSQSLLEALSFGLDKDEDLLPIARRKRVSLPEVLLRSGFHTQLISNQGQRGAYNEASEIIFRNTRGTFRHAQEIAARRSGASAPSRWDGEFFATELARQGPLGGQARLTFLHSYAGHGSYLQNIPPGFRQPVDARLSQMPADRVARNPFAKHLVEEYDSAIRYVDHSVAEAMEYARTRPWPTILLYFSDHGESVFTAKAHDSARFEHEMLRIPFLMYFNDSARRADPARFYRYRALARSGEIATLAQLPSTLLDLLDIEARAQVHDTAHHLLLTPLIGQPANLPAVLVREQAAGITALSLTNHPLPQRTPQGLRVTEKIDEDTRLFLAARSGLLPASHRCSEAGESLESQSSSVMILGCAPMALGPDRVAAGGAQQR